VAVGKTTEGEARYSARRTIQAKDKVVLPALINTHLHHTQQLARGMADECEIERWLGERSYPYEAAMTKEEASISALAGHLDMIKNGTATYIDPGGYYPDETAQVTGETGLRGIITRSTLDIHTSTYGAIPKNLTSEDTKEALKEGEETVKRWHKAFGGRLRAWFGQPMPRSQRVGRPVRRRHRSPCAREPSQYLGEHFPFRLHGRGTLGPIGCFGTQLVNGAHGLGFAP